MLLMLNHYTICYLHISAEHSNKAAKPKQSKAKPYSRPTSAAKGTSKVESSASWKQNRTTQMISTQPTSQFHTDAVNSMPHSVFKLSMIVFLSGCIWVVYLLVRIQRTLGKLTCLYKKSMTHNYEILNCLLRSLSCSGES